MVDVSAHLVDEVLPRVQHRPDQLRGPREAADADPERRTRFHLPGRDLAEALFDLPGTPAADKERLVFPGGHSAPRSEMIRESLQWLDRCLGPVNPNPGSGPGH
jgi:hypothetical protein